MNEVIDWQTKRYIDYIKREIIALKEGKFMGNIEFKVNFMAGGISHINVAVNQSIKFKNKDTANA